jgi:glycosyltransferase involved in cell wall biosynthesis
VLLPNPADYRFGLSQENLAALYTRMDVLLAPSMGEGFGVPVLEAQACGTRVIGSNWAATPDLLSEDSWLTDGQPAWDAGQDAWWETPNIPSLVNALQEAYYAPRGQSQIAIDWAKQFDIQTVERALASGAKKVAGKKCLAILHTSARVRPRQLWTYSN